MIMGKCEDASCSEPAETERLRSGLEAARATILLRNREIEALRVEKDSAVRAAVERVQNMMEAWWNEDPEMRHVEVLCGQNLRVCVRLFQLFIGPGTEVKVGEAEAGSLDEAVRKAIEKSKFACRVCGVQCDTYPVNGTAVCEAHCEDHDYEYVDREH